MDGDSPDWYLQDWLGHFGKKQAALVNELGWNKSRAHFFWHSRYGYRRDVVNEIAAWLGIQPYELLMPPAEALAFRRLRESAATIVGDGPKAPEAMPAPTPRPARHVRSKS